MQMTAQTGWHSTAIVSPNATIGSGVTIGPYSIVYDGVEVGEGSSVGPFVTLGEPTADRYDCPDGRALPCRIGPGALIRSHTVIYAGTVVGEGLRTGHRVTIREGAVIGRDFRVGTLCDIQGSLSIGNHVRFHSNVHIGMYSTIEDCVWIFPYVVLTNDPHPPSDECTLGPTVRKYAVIATHAVLMPGVEIGRHALVGAMALVTRDVPAETVVAGIPAKAVCSVRDVKCKDGRLEHVYPWPTHFTRDYPEEALADALS
jgi:acetyltransferase-like isoleucine patch superfamily enzyme